MPAVAISLVALYAIDQERRAVAARKNAEDILNYLLYDLRDKLQPIGQVRHFTVALFPEAVNDGGH